MRVRVKRIRLFACDCVCALVCLAALSTELSAQHTASPRKVTSHSVEFLSAEQGGVILAGDDEDAFMSSLYPREAAAMTGVPRGKKTVKEARAAAQKFFKESALEFTANEKEQLAKAVQLVVDQFGDKYPLLINRPWKFVKSRRNLCGNFSFTRSDCIVFSEPVVNRIVRAVKRQDERAVEKTESLLLHEQMHVLQRANPALFKPLYESLYSFREADVLLDSWVSERKVTNPDGGGANWVAQIRERDQRKPYWLGTLLLSDKPLHRMGSDFTTVAIPLTQSQNGSYVMTTSEYGEGPAFVELDELKVFTDQFPVAGHDHPNEVAAYMICAVTHGQTTPRLSSEAERVLEASKVWFERNLGAKQRKEEQVEK